MLSLIQEQEGGGWVDKVQGLVVGYGMTFLWALLTLVVGLIVVKMVVAGVAKALNRSNTDPTLSKFLASMTGVALKIVLVIMVINQLGAETTGFVAILGAATFAIGFALQGSLSSFAAGVMIMIFRPFKVGDFIEAGGATGSVAEVGIFATIINTGDNKRVIVANSAITGGNIVNYSSYDKRRVDMEFGIGYGDDIDKAKGVLEEIFAGDERVHKDPAPFIVVAALADSSVNFKTRVWVDSGDYWGVFFDTTEAVKKRFDGAGISIPFPQQDVHMHQVA
jgi:small conductance mechanosensitive channel